MVCPVFAVSAISLNAATNAPVGARKYENFAVRLSIVLPLWFVNRDHAIGMIDSVPDSEVKFVAMPATPIASKMSFFRVPLVCEAAPDMGCGTRARPVLVGAEQAPGVREAWLNREGTMLGIVWAGPCAGEELLRALALQGVAAVELQGEDSRPAYDTFAKGHGWYRAGQMQELSNEEARVIAARLVRRFIQEISLPAAAAERLTRGLEQACARALAEASAVSASKRQEQIASALLDCARNILEAAEFAAFQAVVALGHRPLSGET